MLFVNCEKGYYVPEVPAIDERFTQHIRNLTALLNDYKDDLDYYGVRYFYDFENGFPDSNELYQVNGAFKEKIRDEI